MLQPDWWQSSGSSAPGTGDLLGGSSWEKLAGRHAFVSLSSMVEGIVASAATPLTCFLRRFYDARSHIDHSLPQGSGRLFPVARVQARPLSLPSFPKKLPVGVRPVAASLAR